MWASSVDRCGLDPRCLHLRGIPLAHAALRLGEDGLTQMDQMWQVLHVLERWDSPDCWGQREAANDSVAFSGRSSCLVSITISTLSSCFTVRSVFPVVYCGSWNDNCLLWSQEWGAWWGKDSLIEFKAQTQLDPPVTLRLSDCTDVSDISLLFPLPFVCVLQHTRHFNDSLKELSV